MTSVLRAFLILSVFWVLIAAQSYSFAQVPKPQTDFWDCADVCPEMIIVPPGHFPMGAVADDPTISELNVHQHEVSISYPLAVGKSLVTREEYEAFVSATGRKAGVCNSIIDPLHSFNWQNPGFHQTERDPVVCVTWDDAQAYASWLSARTKRSDRLLSEAEYEYVARAGTTTPYYWGKSASHDYANYGMDVCCNGAASGRDKWIYTSPVGSFPPNAFGLYDTLGNVSEWTLDCWHTGYDGAPNDGAPWQSGPCANRVLRGGDWIRDPGSFSSAFRSAARPSDAWNLYGFRVARTL